MNQFLQHKLSEPDGSDLTPASIPENIATFLVNLFSELAGKKEAVCHCVPTVDQWLALLLHCYRVLGSILSLDLGTFCVELAYSPHVCVGFLPVSSHS